MWYRILHVMQYAGIIIALTLLFNGITYNPIIATDNSAITTSIPASSSIQSLLDTKESDSSIKAAVAENYGKLPLSFEANNGQVDEAVKFLSRGNGYTMYLTSTEVVLSLRRGSVRKDEQQALRKSPQTDESTQVENEVIRLKNIGGNPDPKIAGLKELPGKSNYFIGNDPAKWHTNVSNYAKVKVQDVYPGIDLVYYGNQHQLEYDWIVAPGADPKAIRFAVESRVDLKIDAEENLLLDEKGELRLNKPLIYQQRDGDLTEIAGGYVVLDKHEIGFQLDKYDASLPLVIDPVLSYSVRLGGSGVDYSSGIAIDASGNAYVTGGTRSTDFSTADPLQASYGGGFEDAFVTKLNSSGSALAYSTYLGGSSDEGGVGITIDTSGNAYVTGWTYSTDFPTANPVQASYAGARDAFVAKLNSSGSALAYSTYLGGSDQDNGEGIAIDTSSNAYVSGYTASTNFPTANPVQASYAGTGDAFVAKLNLLGSALVYSTYLGGSGNDGGEGIAIDASGNAYVTGDTSSPDFPTANPLQASNGGYYDAFITKLNSLGSALAYSTYLGGSTDDHGMGIAIDASGSAYVIGYTMSTDFPTADPLQASNDGANDAFVTKLNSSGSALVYSTYLGGSTDDNGFGIAIDNSGNAYVTGWTSSTDFPTANPLQASYGGGFYDAFVTKLNSSGSALVYSTYLGGSSDEDNGAGIAVDASGNAYVTGFTSSTGFPVNEYQMNIGNVFVVKIGGTPAILFPEIAVGGGWSTTFKLLNTGSTLTSGTLFLIDQQGNPLTVNSSSLGEGDSFPISIMPGGSMFLTVDLLNPNDPSKHGWASAEFWGGTLSGVATYQFSSEGVVTALAGVLPSQPTQFATIPVDDDVNQTRSTAYAIANPTSQLLLVKLCLADTEGFVVDDTAMIALFPGQQLASYFFQDFNFSEFKGTVVLRAQNNAAFVAVGLIQNQTLFTVTPVEASKAPNIPNW